MLWRWRKKIAPICVEFVFNWQCDSCLNVKVTRIISLKPIAVMIVLNCVLDHRHVLGFTLTFAIRIWNNTALSSNGWLTWTKPCGDRKKNLKLVEMGWLATFVLLLSLWQISSFSNYRKGRNHARVTQHWLANFKTHSYYRISLSLSLTHFLFLSLSLCICELSSVSIFFFLSVKLNEMKCWKCVHMSSFD